MREVSFSPGTVAAGTAISLPAGAPPIEVILDTSLFRGSDGTVAATDVMATATRVTDTSFSLDVATTARDKLSLRYISRGERGPTAK